ncbi:hypothetical protein HUJ04_011327 [Dendroctonus ponderosae]|nr:hypothetical protein HUJ04_011327 [Dendroctonus ponderosae]
MTFTKTSSVESVIKPTKRNTSVDVLNFFKVPFYKCFQILRLKTLDFIFKITIAKTVKSGLIVLGSIVE